MAGGRDLQRQGFVLEGLHLVGDTLGGTLEPGVVLLLELFGCVEGVGIRCIGCLDRLAIGNGCSAAQFDALLLGCGGILAGDDGFFVGQFLLQQGVDREQGLQVVLVFAGADLFVDLGDLFLHSGQLLRRLGFCLEGCSTGLHGCDQGGVGIGGGFGGGCVGQDIADGAQGGTTIQSGHFSLALVVIEGEPWGPAQVTAETGDLARLGEKRVNLRLLHQRCQEPVAGLCPFFELGDQAVEPFDHRPHHGAAHIQQILLHREQLLVERLGSFSFRGGHRSDQCAFFRNVFQQRGDFLQRLAEQLLRQSGLVAVVGKL